MNKIDIYVHNQLYIYIYVHPILYQVNLVPGLPGTPDVLQ